VKPQIVWVGSKLGIARLNGNAVLVQEPAYLSWNIFIDQDFVIVVERKQTSIEHPVHGARHGQAIPH
jgi:hypothetical protein